MSKYGFKPIGSGKYGSVYAHPKYDYVIKVFMKDTAYLKYLNFVKTQQDNPFVPKIKGKVVRLGDMFMAIRLEKLTPFTGRNAKVILYNSKDDDAIAITNFIDENEELDDLHDKNFMMRGSQLVLVDPFYNWYRLGKFRIDPDDTSEFKNILVKP